MTSKDTVTPQNMRTPQETITPEKTVASRREFLKNTGRLAAASALAGMVIPHVHAAEDNTIQVALIGSGSRGTGALMDALSTTSGPIKAVAMADLIESQVRHQSERLKKEWGDKVDLPQERQFVGFEAYKQAMDCLKPGGVAILTTAAAFHWVHFRYAIEKGLHVFMEKPITVDAPTTRKMLALGEESVKKNLKVGVGLMCRHCRARQELHDRIQAGELGEIISMRAYRMHGPDGRVGLTPAGGSELIHQTRHFHSFLWSGGGSYSDMFIHNIDECCWMKEAWPVQAQSLGGRHYRGDSVDQNFDTYATEYTFPDGTKLFLDGRFVSGCYEEFASYAHCTKGAAVISTSVHTPAKCRIYKGQRIIKEDLTWAFPQPEPNPYRMEWEDLIAAIRQDKPYNEVKRGAEASLVAVMGRMAAHTGRLVTFDEVLNHDHEFAPGVDKMTMDSPAPLQLDANGKYPIPQPGIVTQREY
jgi:predicted dehydrogenase